MTVKQTAKQPAGWPVGAFFHTLDEAGDIEYQGRVVSIEGDTLWGTLFSFWDGSTGDTRPLPWKPERFRFYESDLLMRRAYSIAQRVDPEMGERMDSLVAGREPGKEVRWDDR